VTGTGYGIPLLLLLGNSEHGNTVVRPSSSRCFQISDRSRRAPLDLDSAR